MSAVLSEEQLDYLRSIDSPTVANAIEIFDIRPRTEGYMTPDIKARFPELGPVVGYAVTAKISAKKPSGTPVSRSDFLDYVLSLPGPRVVVMEDIDEPALGAFWGEVQSNVFTAVGCVGCVTNGSVRDLNEAKELNFKFVSKEISVSHGYVHLVEFGAPVTVGGLTVNPGELIHADQHGVVEVPIDAAKEMKSAVDSVLAKERRTIEYCQSPNFTVEGLKKLVG